MDKLRERFTKNAEQFGSLMFEMLDENERLEKLNTLYRYRMQSVFRKLIQTSNFYSLKEIKCWFDKNDWPRDS